MDKKKYRQNYRKPLPKHEPHYCPKCGKEMGRIAQKTANFYCMHCGHEVKLRGGVFSVYRITTNGILKEVRI